MAETDKKIQVVMLPKMYELINELQKDPTNNPTGVHKLSQGAAYAVGLRNGMRPQVYANATKADIYTLKPVPPREGEHNGFHKFSVGLLTKQKL